MSTSPHFTLSFLGAAETVTGSRYLLESERSRVLVDCGLFQGYKKLRQRNWAEPGFSAAAVDAIALTHAHLDHSGYLPRLFNAGFQGPVYCTPGTAALLRVLLPDAGHLQEEEAKYAARVGYSRHPIPEPLFTREDAERSLGLLRVVDYQQTFALSPELSGSFTRAGHIVGSASLRLAWSGASLVFSGDVGRPHDPIMRPPAALPHSDYLVLESTYGDRRHSSGPVEAQLAEIVRETAGRGGSLVIPAFAVGRAQHVLYLLSRLKDARQIPELPIYLDSPMAIDATAIFRQHTDEHALSAEECQAMCRLPRYTPTSDDSKAIDAQSGPLVVISASGMATGGRVLHHLKRFLPDAKNTVLLVGYQSAGTRGRSLADGVDELKLHGQYVPVRAQVRQLDGLSAHADYVELIDWVKQSGSRPRRVFVTHGEPAAADALRRRLRDALGLEAVVPEHGARYALPEAEG
jgi:metallo-beta-lactamase family protein